ncbi:MAG: hypothetical protein H0V44_02280 [Planctomycetes bacterium]|nr:hypothetical protein [Planctomycetota bacterium]
MSDLFFGDGKLHASVSRGPDQITLSVLDRATGRRWPSVPVVTAEVYDKAQFRCDIVRGFRIDRCEAIPDGVHIILGDGFRRIAFGVWLRIRDGELVITVPPSEVYENKPAVYRVFSLVLLPGMMIAAGSAAELILPLNTGMICHPADKAAVSDRFMIYGEQSRWELMPTLPVCAAHGPDGGIMALAAQGAADTDCHVATDGLGSGQVGFGVSLRQHWTDPVDLGQREIRYLPIAPAADAVHAVAKRLRRHVMDDLGKKTLVERAAESPEVAYLLDASIMKLFYGVQNEGIMMYGVPKDGHVGFKQYMSFAEARDGLSRLHAAGIGKVLTQSVGWNPRGHDGLWPTRFPIEERLGGERAFRELIAHGNALGYHMQAHDNYLSSYEASPHFDRDQVIQDVYGEPMGLGEWGGGVTFINWAMDLPDDRLAGEMRRVRALGLRGVAYNDGMGNPLYRNYHAKHRGSRGDYARGVVRILEAARSVYGAAGTETGFLYAALPADSMANPGDEGHMRACRSEWPVTALQDRRVPIWQLALHGLIVLENQGHDWPSTMRAVLMGDHPRAEWSAHPGMMPVLDDAMIGVLKARHDLILGRHGHLQTQELMECTDIAADVCRTRFADGTEVIADFAREELFVDGQAIEAPAALPPTRREATARLAR